MEIIDKFLTKVGTDKVLHFAFGGFICAFITFIVSFQESNLEPWQMISFPIVGHIFVLFVSIIKEMADTKFDWKDIIAALLGSLVIHVSACIGALFNIISN